MQDIIKNKMDILESEIEAIEINIASLENKKADKNKYIGELNNKISALKEEGKQLPSKVLERSECLDKVVVDSKTGLVAEYKLH